MKCEPNDQPNNEYREQVMGSKLSAIDFTTGNKLEN
jgi:hypothetical protein